MILSGKYFLKFLIFNIYIVLSSLSCGDANLYLSGTTMGTTYNIKISENVDSPVYKLQSDIDSILNYVNSIYSTYIPNSEINMFNKSTSEDGFVASNDLMYIVQKANDIYSKSNGYFDITVNNIMSLWSLYEPIYNHIMPSKSEIGHALSKTGIGTFPSSDGVDGEVYPTFVFGAGSSGGGAGSSGGESLSEASAAEAFSSPPVATRPSRDVTGTALESIAERI